MQSTSPHTEDCMESRDMMRLVRIIFVVVDTLCGPCASNSRVTVGLSPLADGFEILGIEMSDMQRHIVNKRKIRY
jgi:hypothetical protein